MKKIIMYIIVVLIVIIAIILIINLYVKLSTRSQIIENNNYGDLKDIDCIVVLGAGIWGDRPSPMLEDRLLQAIELYENNISSKIIMSGDHSSEDYDEVNIMKKFAIEKGVPSENIFMDHAGFSSYESIYRAKEIFETKRIVIVTQKYHLYRALYIANQLGLEAYGVGADPRQYVGATYRELREILARNKDFVKCIFKPEPTFLGDTISVNGSGDVTNDKDITVDKTSVQGNIVEVGDNYIVVQKKEGENQYKIDVTSEINQFTNYRTEEEIKISDIKIGDYYAGRGKIVRNISGEEWKKECIKNLANCYTSGNLICNPREIVNVKNMGNYVIITFIMEDATTKYFDEKAEASTFELNAIANSNLNIPTVSGGVTVYNLKEETDGFMFWIGLDKDTIDNQYPTINDIEIYDK